MPVTRDQLEAYLERIQAGVKDPRHGLFGPDSHVWAINRQQAMFVAGGRAALLQNAHPFVAQGVDQHSLTRADPQGRFKRTFKNVYAMVFGDLDHALTAARRVHTIHERIRGTMSESAGAYAKGSAYEANAEHALLWVHATLWESSIKTYELLFRPLSADFKERYYQETKLFAYLFGISDDALPATWPDFLAYNERMWASDELFVARAAQDMAGFLFTPPAPSMEMGFRWYHTMTVGLLPPRVREMYGYAFGARERAIYEASIPMMRAALRVMPRQLRYIEAYQKARVRIGDPIVPTLTERVVVQSLPKPAPRSRKSPRKAA